MNRKNIRQFPSASSRRYKPSQIYITKYVDQLINIWVFIFFLFIGSLAACNVFVFPGMCMVSLARRQLNGYYQKTSSERRLMQESEGTTKWTFFWSTLFAYGIFIILFGFAMFVIVFFQVVEDISKATQAAESEMLCEI